MNPIIEFCAILITLPGLWVGFILGTGVCLPFYVIRWVIGQAASFLHPEWAGMVGGGDILFAEDPSSHNPKPQSILLGYTTVEGGLTLEELQDKYLQEVILSRKDPRGGLNYPKFQQYFEKWCGYSFWKWEDSFSIQKHIRLLSEGIPHPPTLTEDDLLTLLGPLGNQPFEKGFSPWEYLYVPSYLPKNGGPIPVGLVVMRVHHSLGDGYSFLKSFISYACGVPDKDRLMVTATPSAKPSVKGERSKPVPKELMARFLGHAVKFLRIPFDWASHMLTMDGAPWFLPKAKLSRTCHLGLTPKIPVQLIKDIGRQRGLPFSAILFAAVGGGVRRYFQERGPDDMEQMPGEIQCFVPFPRPGHPDNQLVNHFTTAIIKLFPAEPSAEERLRRSEVDLKAVKGSTFPLTMHFLMTVLSAYPTWYVQLIGGNWFATAILSSFPGPREFVSYFAKYRVPDIVFWTPHLNGSSGIGISMLTYGDSLRFALNVDKTILANQSKVDELCSHIQDELLSFSSPPSTILIKTDENQNRILGKSTNSTTTSSSEFEAAAQLRLRSVS